MKKSSFIFFSAMGLVPIGLINYANLNPFTVIVFLIYALNLPYVFRTSFSNGVKANGASRITLLIVVTLVVSYASMVINRGKYTDWSVLYCLDYFLFWVILREIKSFDDIDQLMRDLSIFVIIAIVWLIFFFINPSVLTSTFSDIRMGSFRGDSAGLNRIFTPGMDYIAYTMVYLLCYLLVGTPKNKTRLVLFFLACLGCVVIITSTRTHLVALIITVVIITLLKFKQLKLLRLLYIPIVAMVIYFALPSSTQNYIDNRVNPLFNVYNIQLSNALSGSIDYGGADVDSFGTVYWRLMEIPFVTTLIQEPHEILLGKIGYLYDFMGATEMPMPHTNFLAFYYLFGLLGVITFGIFIIYFTIKFVKVNLMYRGHPKQYLAVFALCAWANIMLLNGAAFYSPIVIGSCSLIVILERLILNDQTLLK